MSTSAQAEQSVEFRQGMLRVVDDEEDMAVISTANTNLRATIIRKDDLEIATRDEKVTALWKSADTLASSLLSGGRDHSRRVRSSD